MDSIVKAILVVFLHFWGVRKGNFRAESALSSSSASTSCETKLSVLSPKRVVTEWPPEDVLKKSQPPPDWWKMRWICHWTPLHTTFPPFFLSCCAPFAPIPHFANRVAPEGVCRNDREELGHYPFSNLFSAPSSHSPMQRKRGRLNQESWDFFHCTSALNAHGRAKHLWYVEKFPFWESFKGELDVALSVLMSIDKS